MLPSRATKIKETPDFTALGDQRSQNQFRENYNSRYGEDWTERREEVRLRDGKRCALCGSTNRVEIHHIRKHKVNREHDPAKMIALCASCHRKVRNPRSETSRRLARHYLTTGEPDEAKAQVRLGRGARKHTYGNIGNASYAYFTSVISGRGQHAFVSLKERGLAFEE